MKHTFSAKRTSPCCGLFLSMLLFLAVPQWGQAQHFDYFKTIGDTGLPQGGSLIGELPGRNLLIQGGYGTSPTNSGMLFYKCNLKGDTLWSSKIKYLGVTPSWSKREILISPSTFTYSLSALDSGKIKLWRYVCDTNGRNAYAIYKDFKYPGLDSGFNLNLKYHQEKGFYVYGATYPKSYVLWHFDTTGSLRWRQDFADTANSTNFWLNFHRDRILFTCQTENHNMRGTHLLWMDSSGQVLKEKAYSFNPVTVFGLGYRGGPLLLPDSSFVMGFYNYGWDWKHFPWPVLIKFDKNLDTAWTRQLSYPRDSSKINDGTNRQTIDRMLLTRDNRIAVLWHANYNDLFPYFGHSGILLRRLDTNGRTLSEVSLDSVVWYGNKLGLAYNDMIATSDTGFAIAGGSVRYDRTQNRYVGSTYLTKLSDTSIITGAFATKERHKGDILLYPNPGREAITLHTEQGFQNAEIRIYNTLGRKVQSHSHISGSTFIIHRQSALKGIYFLKITDGKNPAQTLKLLWE